MKKFAITALFTLSFLISFASADLSTFRGVWANDSAEAVITNEVCIYYAKIDSTMQAVLEIPSRNFYHQTVFEKDGTVSFSTPHNPLQLELKNGNLSVGGEQLKKIEDVDIVSPYEMARCNSRFDVGKCLQEWRLGGRYGIFDNMPYCEINTNRHMFIYMVNADMVYIRAAACRNNNSGTLFFQNIRMMKNRNTGEYTMFMMPHNFSFTSNDLEIDNSKFTPDTCTFSPDGAIYWSLISFTPDNILINGCGETYQVPRPTEDTPMQEWIRYVPYNSNPFK